MLLQTNSYIVPKDRRAEHARLMRRFRQVLAKLGCDMFEIYEQVGANWASGETNGRYVQIMRFRDRKHQMAVQGAERSDPVAQALIAEFCELVNFQYQQQQGFFAVGFYNSVLPMAPARVQPGAVSDMDEMPSDESAEAPIPDAEAHYSRVVESVVPSEESSPDPAEEDLLDNGVPKIIDQAGSVEAVDFGDAELDTSETPEADPVEHEHGASEIMELDGHEAAEHEPPAIGEDDALAHEHHAAPDEAPLTEDELMGELSADGLEPVEGDPTDDQPSPDAGAAETHGAHHPHESAEHARERAAMYRRPPGRA